MFDNNMVAASILPLNSDIDRFLKRDPFHPRKSRPEDRRFDFNKNNCVRTR